MSWKLTLFCATRHVRLSSERTGELTKRAAEAGQARKVSTHLGRGGRLERGALI